MNFICLVFATAAVALLVEPALGQTYPTRPVRLIVPLTAGSSIDIVARAVASKLQQTWGQPVVVENRTGAGGTIAAAHVAKSAPDGYTLLVSSNGHISNPNLYASLPYDTIKDFVDIAPLAKVGQVMVVAPSAGIGSVAQLVAAARARPNELTFASAGVGTGTHFTAERFKLATGIQVEHVPYRGGVEAMTDVVAGRVTYWFPSVAIALPMIKDGRIVPLGVTTRDRSALLPSVPTLAEAGLVGFDDALWFGVSAPASTPQEVVLKLARDIAAATAMPETIEQFRKVGGETMQLTPSEFAKFVKSETATAASLAKAAGIKPQ